MIEYVYRRQVVFGYVPSSDPICAQTAGRIWLRTSSDPVCAQTVGCIWLRTQ